MRLILFRDSVIHTGLPLFGPGLRAGAGFESDEFLGLGWDGSGGAEGDGVGAVSVGYGADELGAQGGPADEVFGGLDFQ